jgi:hypothetical protein
MTDPSSTSWYLQKDTWAALAGVVALLGTAVPLVAKAIESISLTTKRRRDLQHIEDLADLMEKVNKEDLLSPGIRTNISAQVEEEIQIALDGLGRNRESRRKALETRHKAIDMKEAAEQSDLTLVRRLLLLYWPHGFVAWLAHSLAFAYTAMAVVAVVSLVRGNSADDNSSLLLGAVIIVAGSWIAAWWRRKRWEKVGRLRLAEAATAARATAREVSTT